MNPVQNPHDKLFKGMMSDLQAAEGFLREFLPNEVVILLDFERLERVELNS